VSALRSKRSRESSAVEAGKALSIKLRIGRNDVKSRESRTTKATKYTKGEEAGGGESNDDY
jgi:hypothetical protein